MRIPFLLFIVAALVIAVACSSGSARPQNSDFERLPEIQGSKIYLIPIGDVSTGQMQQLGNYYHGRFVLEIPTLKASLFPPMRWTIAETNSWLKR